MISPASLINFSLLTQPVYEITLTKQLNHQILSEKVQSLYLSNDFEKDLIHNSYLPTDLNTQTQKFILSQFIDV